MMFKLATLRQCRSLLKNIPSYSLLKTFRSSLNNSMIRNHQHENISYAIFNPFQGCDKDLSPVIFLHGMTQSRKSWRHIPQIIANKTKRKVITIDVRNHGDSEWTEELSFNLESESLLNFMNTLNIQKVILVGYCMGGVISYLTALAAPEKVEGIIIEDISLPNINKDITYPVIGIINRINEAFLQTSPNMSRSDVIEYVTDYVCSRSYRTFDPNLEDFEETWTPIKRDSSGRYSVKYNSRALIKCLEKGDKGISIPNLKYNGHVFIIHGEESHIKVLQYQDQIKEQFPKAMFIELKKADHSMHQKFPNEVLQLILICIQNMNRFKECS